MSLISRSSLIAAACVAAVALWSPSPDVAVAAATIAPATAPAAKPTHTVYLLLHMTAPWTADGSASRQLADTAADNRKWIEETIGAGGAVYVSTPAMRLIPAEEGPKKTAVIEVAVALPPGDFDHAADAAAQLLDKARNRGLAPSMELLQSSGLPIAIEGGMMPIVSLQPLMYVPTEAASAREASAARAAAHAKELARVLTAAAGVPVRVNAINAASVETTRFAGHTLAGAVPLVPTAPHAATALGLAPNGPAAAGGATVSTTGTAHVELAVDVARVNVRAAGSAASMRRSLEVLSDHIERLRKKTTDFGPEVAVSSIGFFVGFAPGVIIENADGRASPSGVYRDFTATLRRGEEETEDQFLTRVDNLAEAMKIHVGNEVSIEPTIMLLPGDAAVAAASEKAFTTALADARANAAAHAKALQLTLGDIREMTYRPLQAIGYDPSTVTPPATLVPWVNFSMEMGKRPSVSVSLEVTFGAKP